MHMTMNEEEFRTDDPKGEEMVKYAKHYDENELWEKLRKFGRKAGIKVTYAALLLYYVLKNPATSGKDRAKIIGALGYFILPIDLIPDFIPGTGFADDLLALLYVVKVLHDSITPEIKAKAQAKCNDYFKTDSGQTPLPPDNNR